MKKILSMLIIAIFLSFTSSLAQTPTSDIMWVQMCSLNSNVVAPAQAVQRINCDMLQYNSGTTDMLYAIAWDDFNPGGMSDVRIHLADRASGSSQLLTIPGAKHPDVVWADDPTNYMNAYNLAVVYELNGTVYLNIYSVTIGGTISASLISSTSLQSSFNYAQTDPHIDMFADPYASTWASNVPALHEYVITWTEDQGGIKTIQGYNNDISGPLVAPITSTFIANGEMSDVATVAAVHSEYNQVAHFTYYDPTSSVVAITSWDLGSHFHTTVLERFVNAYMPRIDAFSIGNTSMTAPNCEVVAQINILSFPTTTLTKSYNYTSGALVIENPASTTYSPYSVPVTTAGTGLISSNLANSQYFLPYIKDGSPTDIFIEGVGVTPNGNWKFPIGGGFFSYGWIYVHQPAYPYMIPSNIPSLGIGTCANTGFDYIAALFDGTDIRYRFNLTTTFVSFKTTDITELKKDNILSLHPNPATTTLTVHGIDRASYNITDITGRTVAKGAVQSSNKSIDVSNLPQGMYMIQLTTGEKTETLRFTKQ